MGGAYAAVRQCTLTVLRHRRLDGLHAVPSHRMQRFEVCHFARIPSAKDTRGLPAVEPDAAPAGAIVPGADQACVAATCRLPLRRMQHLDPLHPVDRAFASWAPLHHAPVKPLDKETVPTA